MPPKMLQIRNLPDDLHRDLKIRAAEDGVSMSDWVTARIREALDRPSREQVLHRISHRDPVQLDVHPADLLREVRGPLLAADETPVYAPSSGSDAEP